MGGPYVFLMVHPDPVSMVLCTWLDVWLSAKTVVALLPQTGGGCGRSLCVHSLNGAHLCDFFGF